MRLRRKGVGGWHRLHIFFCLPFFFKKNKKNCNSCALYVNVVLDEEKKPNKSARDGKGGRGQSEPPERGGTNE